MSYHPGLYDLDLSDDDYDELGSDSEDIKPGNDIQRQLTGQLKEPRFKTTNLRQLNELIETGDVDLNPAYQRDVVWSTQKQIMLIQSLFLNYYVPPVIFAKHFLDDDINTEVRVCIDGKQRCTSIVEFIKGKIPFKSPKTGDKFWYTTYASGQHGGRPLPPVLKRMFDNISIQIVEYDDLDMDQQRDIFQRVQMGMALSAAEKLQALGGPWGEWCTELEKKYITAEGAAASNLPKFDILRGRPFQVMSAFIIMAHENKVAPSAVMTARFLERTDPPEPEFVRKIEMALGLLNEIAADYYRYAFAPVEQRVAPVEFWNAAYLIYTRMGCMSVKSLAKEINAMREDIRSQFIDIRSNTKVGTALFEFINQVRRNKLPGEVAAAEEFESDHHQQRTLKRRREEEERDGTYTDNGLSRGQDSAVVGNLRSKKSIKTSPKSTPVTQQRPTQQYVASIPPAPRPSISMDAPIAPPPYTTQTLRNTLYNPQNQFSGYK